MKFDPNISLSEESSSTSEDSICLALTSSSIQAKTLCIHSSMAGSLLFALLSSEVTLAWHLLAIIIKTVYRGIIAGYILEWLSDGCLESLLLVPLGFLVNSNERTNLMNTC